MAITFKKATKTQSRLRLAMHGPSGSGKTFTALKLAAGLGKTVAVIDTERGSAAKYSDVFNFDTVDLESFSPGHYLEAIEAARNAGYEVLILDSLSHAWSGKGGALEMVDEAARRSKSGNTFGAWREVTPQHNALVDAILSYPGHVIATMRSKTDYVQEKDSKTGRTTVRKVGLAPIQRDGLEYEFDVVAELTPENEWITGKTRCSAIRGKVVSLPNHGATEGIVATLQAWLTDGAPASNREPPAAPSVIHPQEPGSSPAASAASDPFAALCESGRKASTQAEVDACVQEAQRLHLTKEQRAAFAPIYEAARARAGRAA